MKDIKVGTWAELIKALYDIPKMRHERYRSNFGVGILETPNPPDVELQQEAEQSQGHAGLGYRVSQLLPIPSDVESDALHGSGDYEKHLEYRRLAYSYDLGHV